MTSSLILVCGLIAGASDRDTSPSTVDLADYEKARAAIGRDADAQVRLALWCEAHGLQAERLKHLALAVIGDPKNAAARGLMGLVAFNGQWKRPESVVDKVKADEALTAKLAEYNARRERTPETADAQYRLALWCEEHGLNAEAKAHFATVTRLNPSNDSAWKHLGCKKVGGRWMREEELAAEKEEADAQKKADQHWKPLLTKWAGWLGQKSLAEQAEKELAEVTDPRAVRSIWSVLVAGNKPHHDKAVEVLARIDGPGASRALAALAVFSPVAETRRAAAETLQRRDPREFAELMIGWLRERIKYEIRYVKGPGSPGELVVEGENAKLKRVYTPRPILQPGDVLGADDFGVPVVARRLGNEIRNIPLPSANGRSGNRQTVQAVVPKIAEFSLNQLAADATRSAVVAEAQLENDALEIDRRNAPIAQINDRVRAILSPLAGRDLGEQPETWQAWYTDMIGYAFVPRKTPTVKPTYVEQVQILDQPRAVPVAVVTGAPIVVRQHSYCFGAGTLVHTLTGILPIETVRAGDQVLVQNPRTGALTYQPVLSALHNPPNATLRVRLGDESVVATGIHRIWKAGQGWVMARELKPGDRVRTLDGTATVTAVEEDATQPVFNLEVAEGASFFVGQRGVLVHDNSRVLPTPEPFDASPSLAAITNSSSPN